MRCGLENSATSKIVTACFGIFAIIVGFTLRFILDAFAGAFLIITKLMGSDLFRHGVPFAVGFGLFLFFMLNKKVRTWADEVVIEVKKVVWPSGKDVRAMTIAVLIMVMISSAIIMGFDVSSSYLVKKIVSKESVIK